MGLDVPVHRSKPVQGVIWFLCVPNYGNDSELIRAPRKLVEGEQNVSLLLPHYQYFCQDDGLVLAF